MKREKVLYEERYRRGAPADKQAVFRAWRDAARIDVSAEGIVEMGGKEYQRTTVVLYVARPSNG